MTTALVVRRPSRPHVRLVRAAEGFGGVVLACLLWELVRFTGLIDPRDLPGLGDIAVAIAEGLGDRVLLPALGSTVWAWALGLVSATIIGAIVGIALGLSRPAEIITRPIIEFLRPIPSVALIPIGLMVIGLGLPLEIVLIVFASVWPVLFSVKAGVEDTDPRFLDTGRVLGLGRVESVIRIVLPNSLPSLATGVRISASIALVLAITVEMVTGQPGLGAYLSDNRLGGQTEGVWAAVFLSGFLGYVVNILFLLAERRAFRWSAEHREA